ncbi:hypothetical protein Cgig2_012992 [Carnegiea gigantea]|uniref:Sulfotransferase n=1 Tax=Carnegiea gigantea TaxID=171969 RepID=A0A9Q1K9W0_9CARY|nr:hypothetical protein Cgig2_012992 [Carnegiea gigantea]
MTMAEEIFFFDKSTLVIKAPKGSPLIMRMVLVVMVMVSGVYICCSSGATRLSIEVINKPKMRFISDQKIHPQQQQQQHCSHSHQLNQSESHFQHYPKPRTFSRLFAIVSMQRSGSGWFETMLNSHMNVSSNGEIFSVKERRSNASAILTTLDQVYNLDWFTSASKNECSAAAGLKWMLNQGLMEHHEEILKYFRQKGVSIIFLFRRNLLRRMVSVLANSYDRAAPLLNGTHKSHVHSTSEAQILASYKPRINAMELKPKLKQEEEAIARALEFFNGTRHLVLFYEDIITNTTKLHDVQEFLRLPFRNLTSCQVKIHSRPLERQVENWDEIANTLNQTAYERFLRADY